MFYFIQFANNNIVRIILLTSLATLLFYTLGSIVQKFFHFKTYNNNFTIPLGIIIYLLITFVLYTPFLYFHLDNDINLFRYLYLIKEFIFTFVVLLFLNSLFTRWNSPGWKQIGNFFFSFIIIGFLLWAFHFLLIFNQVDSPILPLEETSTSFQSMITELNIIIKMNNNIDETFILEWYIPFIIISLLYWSTKLLFENIMNFVSVMFSIILTMTVIVIFSFLIIESLIYIIIPLIYLYFILIFLYTKETFENNLIIFFAFFVLASIFTISSSGIVFLLLLGIPTIGYLFLRAKSTVSLFLLFFTLFIIQLFFILTALSDDFLTQLYGLIFLVVAIIILIPMYAILNPTKIKDLIQVEKNIKKSAILILYLSLGITLFFSLLLGIKSNNSVFKIIEDGFKNMSYPTITISLISFCILYFIFSFYICFFRKRKANNLLLITSLIIVIGFNPLILPLFYYVDLMTISIFQTYYFVFGICFFLNLFKYLKDKLNFYHFFNYKNTFLFKKTFFKKNLNSNEYLTKLKNK